LYTYGYEHLDASGNIFRVDNPGYVMAMISVSKLTNEVTLQHSNKKFVAFRFEPFFSEKKR
jgi:hypothetical protein